MDVYENFIKHNKMCDFEQSLKWNKIKTYWLNEQIIIKKDNEIKLTANILIRKIPIFGTIMYIPRGPIGEIENKDIIYELTEKLKLLAKKYKAFVVLMEPDILKSNKEFKKIAKSFGYRINNTPIAGIMPLTYGNKTWYLYGASSNSYRNLMPNYLLQWEAIKLAKKNDSILYDFKGCSFKGNKPDGLYRFKKGFGTELVELIGEVNLEIKPIRFHLFKLSKRIYCYLRKIKYNLKNKN